MKKQHEILSICSIETAMLLYGLGICIVCNNGTSCTIEKEVII
jgi:hypothetical protein